jgi:hypothetical protein
VWKRDDARKAMLIASALNHLVADLVLAYSDVKDIWYKVVRVFLRERYSSTESVDDGVLQAQTRSRNEHCSYVAKVEISFSDMNKELRPRGSHDTPIELLHVQILATVEPEYQEFSNVWELLDDNKRTTVCLGKCVRLKNGYRHKRQRQSQVHSWHMRQPRNLNL